MNEPYHNHEISITARDHGWFTLVIDGVHISDNQSSHEEALSLAKRLIDLKIAQKQ